MMKKKKVAACKKKIRKRKIIAHVVVDNSAFLQNSSQGLFLNIVLGNGIASLILSKPQIHATTRSTPIPNPE